MTYRIENLDSDGRNSELCLVRSKNMRRTTLQVIGKCFIGLGAVGIVVLWIQLERWQSTSNVLFPILFCLGLIAICFGGYLLSFPFHKWPTKISFVLNEELLLFGSESHFSADYAVPYAMLSDVRLLRKRVRSNIGSSRVRLDVYRIAMVFKNLSRMTLLTFKPVPGTRAFPREYFEPLNRLRALLETKNRGSMTSNDHKLERPSRFFSDSSSGIRELFWHSRPQLCELWLCSIPAIVLLTLYWIHWSWGIRVEILVPSSIFCGFLLAVLALRIALQSAQKHHLKFSKMGLEVEITGLFGQWRWLIPRDWIGNFQFHFPELGGCPAIDVIERSEACRQNEQWTDSLKDIEGVVDDLHVLALPLGLGKRRRVTTPDLSLPELIFVTEWLNSCMNEEEEALRP